jgi:hypothetical protein
MQALRLYALCIVSVAAVGVTSYLGNILVPELMMAVLTHDRGTAVRVLAWGVPTFVGLSTALAISLYYGERLALDWRRALTRRVRCQCAGG